MSVRWFLRVGAAFALTIALLVIAVITYDSVQDADAASAVQVIQAFAEGAFLAITAIGIGVACYVGSRADD